MVDIGIKSIIGSVLISAGLLLVLYCVTIGPFPIPPYGLQCLTLGILLAGSGFLVLAKWEALLSFLLAILAKGEEGGKSIPTLTLKKSWDKRSADYQQKTTIPADDVCWGEFVALESQLGILGNLNGQRVLEIGCGGAQNSIALAKWGAQVTAIDLSTNQIRHGKRLAVAHKANVNLIVCDMQRLPFRNQTFSLVLTALSLQYVTDLVLTAAEVGRVLVTEGHFTFSALHPLIEGKLVKYKGKPAIVISGYFHRRTIRWLEKLRKGTNVPIVRMNRFYRPLQDYFEALAQCGFVTERYLEPERLEKSALHPWQIDVISKSRDAQDRYAFTREAPRLFVLKARKIVRG